MRLFLQINIGQWQQESYEKPLLSYASSLADDILGTDLDNQSDPYVVSLVRQLIEQASSTFVVFRIANENSPLDGLLGIINQLFVNESGVRHVVLYGSHEALLRMLLPIGERLRVLSNEEDIRKEIAAFAEQQP